MNKGKHIVGRVNLKSNLSIDELGKIISENILGGAVLDGLEKNIYDEVPAIFVQKGLLGLSVILQGYSGYTHEIGYFFEVIPNFNDKEIVKETVDFSNYFVALFKSKLENEEITVINENNIL